MHQFLFYNEFIIHLYMHNCAHHQEVKIVSHSIWHHHTLHVSSTIVLIIRRSKSYHTASGTITLCRRPSYNEFIIHLYMFRAGTAVAQWLRCCATNRKVAGSIPEGVIGFFIDIKSFWSHYGPGVDSASNRNEYQEYFLGVKAASA